jgi:hypothetical protein
MSEQDCVLVAEFPKTANMKEIEGKINTFLDEVEKADDALYAAQATVEFKDRPAFLKKQFPSLYRLAKKHTQKGSDIFYSIFSVNPRPLEPSYKGRKMMASCICAGNTDLDLLKWFIEDELGGMAECDTDNGGDLEAALVKRLKARTTPKPKSKYYNIIMWSLIQEELRGPYPSKKERDLEAAKTATADNLVLKLTVSPKGKVTIENATRSDE